MASGFLDTIARHREGFTPGHLAIRGLTVACLAAVSFVAGVFVWQHPAHPPSHITHVVVAKVTSRAPHPMRVTRAIAPSPVEVVPQKIAVPAKQSDFDRERRMSPAALMSRWAPVIAQASKRFSVPETWIRAVMKIESGGRTMSGESLPITSNAGALGLMQIMPATYSEMRGEYRLGPDPQTPRDNILAGAAYLHWLYGKYGYPAMFAAYNDGPGNLEARLVQGQLLPAETQNYVGTITLALGTAAPASHETQIKFTRPNGVPVFIDTTQVVSVRAPFAGEYAPGVQSVIAFGRVRQGVCENVDAAKAAIRARGGRV